MAKKKEETQSANKLDLAVKIIEKEFGVGAITTLADTPQQIERLSSGSRKIDGILGGGFPKGRIIEILGPEMSGKSTAALHAVAECQMTGGTAAYVDAEHALDSSYAENIGVDTNSLLMSQPDNGEQALEIVSILTSSGEVDLIVVDSVAALTPKAEIEGTMTDQQMGLQARMMAKAMRLLTSKAAASGTTIIFINQIRHKIGVIFGSNETTPGGNALKFFASVRLDIRRTGSPIKDGEEITALRSRVKCIKNKTAPPLKVTEIQINFGTGIDKVAEILDEAVDRDIVEKSGAWYSFKGERLGQGKENSLFMLRQHTHILEQITQLLDHNAPPPIADSDITIATAN